MPPVGNIIVVSSGQWFWPDLVKRVVRIRLVVYPQTGHSQRLSLNIRSSLIHSIFLKNQTIKCLNIKAVYTVIANQTLFGSKMR
jgi:hypothetical protein